MASRGQVIRILVVEDEPSISNLCQRVLSSEGFEVDVAANGKVAQNMINRKRYDLCLIDMRTPTMSGMELYQWIKEKHSYLARGIIFTTGDVLGSNTQEFLSTCNQPFLPKPFTPDELRVIVCQTVATLRADPP